MLGTTEVRLPYNFSTFWKLCRMYCKKYVNPRIPWSNSKMVQAFSVVLVLPVKMHSSATKMITLSFSKKFSLTLGKQISLILQSWNKFNEFCHKRLEKRTDCCHIPWKLWKISFSDQSCFLSPSSIGNKMWFSVLLRVFFWGF